MVGPVLERNVQLQHELPSGTLPPFLQGLIGSILSRRDWLTSSLPLMHDVLGGSVNTLHALKATINNGSARSDREVGTIKTMISNLQAVQAKLKLK